MNFFQSVFRSLHDFSWVANQRFASVSRALGFFSLVVLIVTTVRTGPTIFFSLPPLVKEAVQIFATDVPDFEGTLTTSSLSLAKLPQPYQHEGVWNQLNYSFFVDTVSTSTPSMVELLGDKKYDLAVLVNSQELQVYDGEAKSTEVVTFADMFSDTQDTEPVHFSKASIQQNINSFQEKIMPYAASVLFILVLLGVWVVKFFATLFWSLIFMWIAQSMGKQWSYGDIFKIVLYAMAVPMIVGAVLQWFGFTVPLLSTLLLVLVMYLVIKADEIEKKA